MQLVTYLRSSLFFEGPRSQREESPDLLQVSDACSEILWDELEGECTGQRFASSEMIDAEESRRLDIYL